MAKARIIAGKSGLSNRIRWVYKPENMNFAKWVKGQEHFDYKHACYTE